MKATTQTTEAASKSLVVNKGNWRHQSYVFFAFTWAYVGLIHQLSFINWRWTTVHGLLLSTAVLLVLHRLSAPWRLLCLAGIDWLAVAWKLPEHPNHIIFSWVINLTLITTWLIARNRCRPEQDFRELWTGFFAPLLRCSIAILFTLNPISRRWLYYQPLKMNLPRVCYRH
jgi:hypothetical protein